MIRINQIKIPVQKDETSALKKKIQKTLRTNHPYTYQIVRKSLDARDKGNLLHIYTVDVEFERSQDIPRNIIDNKNIMLIFGFHSGRASLKMIPGNGTP